MTVDLKKRRLGGRDQILNGGEHLIDGVPFGRPRLRIPRGRPAVSIAPRKRRRLTYGGEDDADDADDDDYPENEVGCGHEDDDGEVQLLLTHRGERRSSAGSRRVRFSPETGADAKVHETDKDGESELESEEQDEQEDDVYQADSQELAYEAADLMALAEEDARYGMAIDVGDDDDDDDSQAGDDRQRGLRGTVRTRSARQLRSAARPAQKKTAANVFGPIDEDDSEETSEDKDAPTRAITSVVPANHQSRAVRVDISDPGLQDKITAVRFAFPQVSARACGNLLIKHNKDVRKVWNALAKTTRPRQELAETMVMATTLELAGEVRIVSSPEPDAAGALEDVSRIHGDEEDGSSNSGEDASDSESDDSDSPPEELTTRRSQPSNVTADDDSPISSEDSSSESESESETPPRRGTRQPKARTSPGNAQRQDGGKTSRSRSTSSDDTSDSDVPVIRRTGSRRGRRIVESSPASSKVAQPPTRSVLAAKGTNESSSSESDSDDESSSDSSSDSSSESSSDSDDDPQAVQPPKTKTAAKMTAAPKSAPKRSSTKPAAPTIAPQSSAQRPVPPGQGLTKTQRRNQRRRREAQWKKAGSQNTQDTTMADAIADLAADLAAKKAALLQTLGTGPTTADGDSQPMSDAVGHGNDDPDAWRQKISYRAVEVVQEGIELSEPPFPFVQRWDPQQRWDNSQRRGKRKSRDDFQFYDDSTLQSAKKMKVAHSVDYDDYYEEDTTAWHDNQHDVVLDYDDASFNPDEGLITDGYGNHSSGQGLTALKGQVDVDTDDLPPLPQDMESLPKLQASDLKTGMIIAYKQLLCTEATNWQPQLSDFVTATVTQIYDGGGDEFQVQLAKRDMNLDRNERKYDEETGQRVYGKFEAPDEDDDEADEEDAGFRDISLGLLQDCRIVQVFDGNDEVQTGGQPSGDECPSGQRDSGLAASQGPELLEPEFEVADSQTKERYRDGKTVSNPGTGPNVSGTLDHEHDSRRDPDTSGGMDLDPTELDATVDESFVPETMRDVNADNIVTPADVDGVSITADRRTEISQVINDGESRHEVRSSIHQPAFLRLGSPSRQLEEEMEASVLQSRQVTTPPRRSQSSDEAPSEYGSKEPSQVQEPNEPSEGIDPETFHSAPQTPSMHRTGSEGLNADGSAGRVASAGKVHYPKLAIGTSQNSLLTQSSQRSAGRQLDPNFVTHSDDLGIGLTSTDSPSMTNGLDDDAELGEDAVPMGDDDAPPMGDEDAPPAEQNDKIAPITNTLDPVGDGSNEGRERMHAQQIYNDDLQNVRARPTAVTPPRSSQLSPPGSGGSTGSSSRFTDIAFIGSQPVHEKLRGFSPKVKDESVSSKNDERDEPVNATEDDAASPWDTEHVPSSLPPAPGSPHKPFSGQGKHNNDVNYRSVVDAFPSSISPPALSRLRRNPDPTASLSASSSQDNSDGVSNGRTDPFGPSRPVDFLRRTTNGAANHFTGLTSPFPKGSQVDSISILSSNSEPEPDVEESEPELEPEPKYAEMYADGHVDGDYHGGSSTDNLPPRSKSKRMPSSSSSGSKSGGLRGASVPVTERNGEIGSTGNWVSGSQGPSRKPSGRFSGRLSAAGF